MLKVYKIYPHGFASNSYILTKDGTNCAVIDCAQDRVWAECTRLGLKPQGVLLTHGHYDHIGGCAKFCENGVPVYAGGEEAANMFSPEYTCLGYPVKPFKVTAVSGGQTLCVAGINFNVISTPGHTSGGVSYLADDCLFTGDTLFPGACGRVDLPSSNPREMRKSLLKLSELPEDTQIFAGHSYNGKCSSTIGYERLKNPFMRNAIRDKDTL